MEQQDSRRDRRLIAAFDFDGTLTTKDTLFEFLLFYFPLSRLAAGFALLSPMLLLYKLKVISNNEAKERLFRYFFNGTEINGFNQKCREFAAGIEKLLRPEAIAKLKWHQESGHQLVIISASPENWILPWAGQYGVKVLATKLEVVNGHITGKFLTNNCYGGEKVVRLLSEFPDRGNYGLYAYGDSNGDKELLAAADFKFYRSF
ncbi:HAD-IB family hydrolase [Hufsiella ginkgonis]|uniref:HAD-IB family hydrolase n=1 Tax=Hufsiella ginkgonis TaxID=2695274 RepID=A0A7K1XYV2_9SPHI|nr:HAD-IB family hydrolase [Hufsiella ginkgonis]MXV16174.1 HAD-IB family hydrolase [Hufsiella ginkgonis]